MVKKIHKKDFQMLKLGIFLKNVFFCKKIGISQEKNVTLRTESILWLILQNSHIYE